MPDAQTIHVPPNPLDHQGLVGVIAKRFRGCGLDVMDLLQEGQFGLLLACERFDPSRGYEFQSYARRYIKGYMRKAIHLQGKLIRLPAYWHATLKRLDRGQITADELPGWQRERLPQALRANQTELRGHWASDFHAARPRPTESIDTDDADRLWRLLDTLPARERHAVVQWYGLAGEPVRLADIGRELGVTTQRAQQFVQLGVGRLRRRFRVCQEVA